MKIKLNNNSGLVYFIISTIIFTMSILGPENQLIDIPHIVLNDVTPTTLVCLLSVLIILVNLIKNNPKVDLITILLVLRVFFSLVPCFYIEDMPDFYGNLETTILCIFSYFIAKNYVCDTSKVEKAILLMFVIICLQVIFESVLGPVSYFDDTYIYKNNLIIPIGGSNAIASRIIPCFAFLYCTNNQKYKKLFLIVLLFLTLCITKSRSGIIAGIIMLAIVKVWKSNIALKDIIKIILLLMVLGVIFLFIINKTEIGQYAFYNNASTILNRFERWRTSVDLFWSNPIFGVSYLAQEADYNPHNWIISICARGGIIGFIIAIIIIMLFLKNLKGCYNNIIVRGCVCFAISMLVQGLAEIVLFTSTHDFFFWFLLGIAINEARKIKSIESDRSN